MNLYKTHVRCLLEYCSPVWSPSSQVDIDRLEKVQQQAVGMVSGLRSNTYEGKLRELGMVLLKHRREQSDMIKVYKIVYGINNTTSGLL